MLILYLVFIPLVFSLPENATKIQVNIDNTTLILALPRNSVTSNVYTLCASFDLEDEHCSELLDFSRSLVSEIDIARSAKSPPSYSNTLVPSYVISLNRYYTPPLQPPEYCEAGKLLQNVV
jgi:hypothetical protein